MMSFRHSLLLLFTLFVSTCMAESPFNSALVGVIVVVGILLTLIVATAVALLIIWMRWQKSEKNSNDVRLDLEASPRQRRLRELSLTEKTKEEEAKEEEAEEEERYGEQIQQPVRAPSPPVYSTPVTQTPVHRPPSPTDSFTSDGGNEYHNVGRVIGATEYDDIVPTKSGRCAPPPPANKAQEEKKADDDKPSYENTGKRRAPPPKPVIVGEEVNTSTTFGSSNQTARKAEQQETSFQSSQITPAAVKQHPVPPTKPKSTEPPPTVKPKLNAPPPPPSKPKSSSPPAPPTKSSSPPAPPTKSSSPPAPPTKPKTTEPLATSSNKPTTAVKPKLGEPPAPPSKPKSSEPPAPPSKPKSSEPPAPPSKPKSSEPPAPPSKPKSSEPPAPPSKPKSSEPPAPPSKPKSSEPPAPPSKPKLGEPLKPPTKPQATKPKPQIQPRSAENQGQAPKPKVKPRIPTKPSETAPEGNEVPVTDFGEHVASLHADGNTGFSREFDSLPTGESGYAIFDAIMPLHAHRNRHTNIIPYNHNRLKLKPVPGYSNCQHDYINASFIEGISTHTYIATQGPNKETLIDFWRLVWQERVPVVAMVTALHEESGSKCERYWPEFGSVVHGLFRVSLTRQQVLANYTLSTLQVGRTGSETEVHTVQHIHFTGWLDNSSPEQAGPLLSYLRRIRSLHERSKGPLLVHCSAGVGRTGSLLAIDQALEQARQDGSVNIPNIILLLRRQRMKMVQTLDQYMFIHDAVLEQLVCGDTQLQATDFNRALQRLQQPQFGRESTSKTGLALQFDVLEQVSPKSDDVQCQHALMFPSKNRSTDFLPPDDRRVELGRNSGYIHASFVQGYLQKEAFIIAQAPLEETCRDFWKMIEERQCGVIVMLSAPLEEYQLCAQYWSEEMEDFERQYGEVSVRTTHRQQMSGYAIHKMNLTNRRSGAQREIVQFQLTSWDENDLWRNPSTLMEAIHCIKGAQRKAPNKPIVVHGRDTVSRCGLLCALMVIIDQCATEGVVDVFQVVKALRLAKPGCVNSLVQYKHLFQLTTAYLDSFDTYANFK